MKNQKNMDLSFKSKRNKKNSTYIFYVNYIQQLQQAHIGYDTLRYVAFRGYDEDIRKRNVTIYSKIDV